MGEMVPVPGGTFQQGSPPWVLDLLEASDQPLPRVWFADETPPHTVTVRPYWIDRHPVTVAEFAEFAERTGHVTDAEERGFGLVYTEKGWREVDGVCWRAPGGPGTSSAGMGDHPVVHVSWFDCVSYAEWAGKRLPTESEWEYAARGGAEFRLWPWGDEWDVRNANTAEFHAGALNALGGWKAWWEATCAEDGPIPRTTPVGAFSKQGDSPFGCADMAGNVYEWTSTLSHLYDDATECDPSVRAAMGRYRVIRGGSWMNFRHQTRCSERMHGDPTGWSSFAHGFRCAKDA